MKELYVKYFSLQELQVGLFGMIYTGNLSAECKDELIKTHNSLVKEQADVFKKGVEEDEGV